MDSDVDHSPDSALREIHACLDRLHDEALRVDAGEAVGGGVDATNRDITITDGNSLGATAAPATVETAGTQNSHTGRALSRLDGLLRNLQHQLSSSKNGEDPTTASAVQFLRQYVEEQKMFFAGPSSDGRHRQKQSLDATRQDAAAYGRDVGGDLSSSAKSGGVNSTVPHHQRHIHVDSGGDGGGSPSGMPDAKPASSSLPRAAATTKNDGNTNVNKDSSSSSNNHNDDDNSFVVDEEYAGFLAASNLFLSNEKRCDQLRSEVSLQWLGGEWGERMFSMHCCCLLMMALFRELPFFCLTPPSSLSSVW